MKLSFVLLLYVLTASMGLAKAPLIAETDPLSPEEQQKRFKLPEGFEIQLVASEPSIGQPMNLNFDVHGRLWVTHTLEYPYPAKDTKKARDKLTLFSGIGRDGQPQSHTNFLERLNIPIGIIPLGTGDTAVVHSIPDINLAVPGYKEKLYGTVGQQDTHGMVNGFTQWLDGWIYGCHGFRNSSTITDASGNTTRLQSGNTYRFKPDGSHFEQWTWGQVNPFGLVFDEWGNIFTADCHSKPLTQLLRGAYYPSFGKPHDGLGFGPDMIDHNHGSTGICGPAYYMATDFPREYQGTLFLCNPVNGTVHWDKLKSAGSTLLVESQPDFITCDDPWFRPVDTIMGPDGALYIADFYNAIIGHYEVRLDHPKRDRSRGRVWRVVHKDGEHQFPDITNNAHNEINSDNLFVRNLVTNYLVHQREIDIPGTGDRHHLHGMWIKERVRGLSEEEIAELNNQSDLIRTHLFKLLANRSQLSDLQRDILKRGLSSTNAFVVRAAGETLGQHVRSDQTLPLITTLDRIAEDDTHLRHALRIAIRNHLAIPHAPPDLKPSTTLADIFLAIKQSASIDYLTLFLRSTSYNPNQNKYLTHLGQYAGESNLVPVISHYHENSFDEKVQILQAIQDGLDKRNRKDSSVTRNPARDLVHQSASQPSADIAKLCILIQRFKLIDEKQRVASWLRDATQTKHHSACANTLLSLEPNHVLSTLVKYQPSATVYEAIIHRKSARDTELLASAMERATDAGQTTLAQHLVQQKSGAQSLLNAIERGKASARLLGQPNIKSRINMHRLNERAALLTKELPPASKETEALIKKRATDFKAAQPDLVNGADIFTQQCAICHKVNSEGGVIGPHLDGIGARGSDRLIEDILDPNRNIDNHFKTTLIKTKNDITHTGLFLREEGAITILGDASGSEIQIPTDEILENVRTNLSPMPAAFGSLIPEKDFHDLIGYLLSL